jgi:ribosomal protein L22
MEENKDAVTEKLKASVEKLRLVVEVVADKALERAILIEETTKELDALALEIEGRETELLGGEKVEDETEEVEMRIDPDPASPTYNTLQPIV